MNALTKYRLIIISLGVLLGFSISNLIRQGSINWVENLIIALFVVAGYKIIEYFSGGYKRKQNS